MEQFDIPKAYIGPALLAWYRMIGFKIPDPAPIELGQVEAAQLAKQVIHIMADYIPAGETVAVTGTVKADLALELNHVQGFRQTNQVEVYSSGAAPGCCVQSGGHLVCVR